MGYWDKREPKQEPEKKERTNVVDHEALQQLEDDTLETARATLDEIEGIAEEIKKQKTQASDVQSSNYWCAIVFNNQKQKEEFLQSMGFDPSWTFIPGKDFVRKVGKYSEPDHDYSRERRVQQAFKDRARPISFKPAD